ncbi:hypothetical protein [Sebaldella sp. S0638]|uniref:hypothetical protein n=1 Tax=Sebaldella sp. S0638 TaxID=2957809 RepID=UPI00209CF085|nr:hypothetical protein [Sebaldella sp. S0638]MCP1226211.1 hypothetical protein [Sebaldella sp. S0638]
MEKIIGITFTMILGLVFLLIGRFFLVKDKKLKNKGGKSTAKIIEKKSEAEIDYILHWSTL